jgi:hypothetical protein
MRLERLFYALTVAATLVGCGSGFAAQRALLIGVNHYPGLISQGRAGGRDLQGAVADAQTFQDVLIKIFKFDPASIEVLTDETATRERILTEFKTWLIDGTKPGDTVVFYYAGHGAQAVVKDTDGSNRLTSTIVPADAKGDLDAANPEVSGMIRGDEIGGLLGRIADRQTLVVADSCFSGSISRGEAGLKWGQGMRTLTPARPLDLPKGEVTDAFRSAAKMSGGFLDVSRAGVGSRTINVVPVANGSAAAVKIGSDVIAGPQGGKGSLVVWSAATVSQVTFDDPEVLGGVFTQSLAARLRQAADDPSGAHAISGGGLLQYVRAEADRFCKQFGPVECANGLTPQLQAPDGYMLQVLAPSAVSPAPAPQPAKYDDVPALTKEAVQALTHQNDFSLAVKVLPGDRIKLHDEVRVSVRSAEPGALVIIDRDADGRLHQLFPNQFSERSYKGGLIHADVDIMIPDQGFRITADDAGSSELLVLVAEPDVDLKGIVGQELQLQPIAEPKDFLGRLATKLLAPKLSADPNVPNRAYRWAFATASYTIGY